MWMPVVAIAPSLSILGITVNIFVLVVIFRSKRLNKFEFSKFIINQSLIDGISCLTLMFSHFNLSHFHLDLTFVKGRLQDEVLCRVWVNDLLLWGFLVSSTYHIVAVSLQKYGQIVHPLRHRECFNGKLSWLTLGLPWLCGPMYSFATLIWKAYVHDGICELNVWATPATGRIIGTLIMSVQFFIPMTVIVMCYAQILITIRKRWQPVYSRKLTSTCHEHHHLLHNSQQKRQQCQCNLKNVQCGAHNSGQQKHSLGEETRRKKVTVKRQNTTRDIRKKKKLRKKLRLVKALKVQQNVIKTLTLIGLCFFLCWVSNTSLFFLINIGIIDRDIYDTWVFEMSVIGVFANPVIKPFIYIIEFRPFRKVIIGMIKCTKKQEELQLGRTSSTLSHSDPT